MFGLDFVMDENLNLWFIECNASPQLIGTNELKTKFLVQMLEDMFKIEYAYLRSRWRRIQQFAKEYYNEQLTQKKSDAEYWKRSLEKALVNQLESEYSSSVGGTWEKILDENIEGAKKYYGFLEEECMTED